MNYKLLRDNFIEITEKSGLIENNGYGYIEFAITESEPKQDDPSNTVIEKNGKLYFQLTGGQKLYGRSVTHLTTEINVSELAAAEIEGGFDPALYYNKTQSDSLFVKKDGDKVLSSNDFTNELKEKLEDIKAKDVSFDDGETFQQKLDDGKLNGKSVYDIAKDKGFKGSEGQYISTLHGRNATTPIYTNLTNEEGIIKYSYKGVQEIGFSYIKDYKARTESDTVSTLTNLNISNLGEDTELRVELLSFFGLDDNGVVKGTTNPARRVGVVPAGSFPHLKELDPTLEKTFPIAKGNCKIELNLDYKEMTDPELESVTRLGATHIGFIEVKLVALPSNTNILFRHFFNKTIDDNTPKELINLQQPAMFKGLEGINFVYCDELEYQSKDKIQDDNVIYMVKNNDTGIITFKVYRP